MSKLYLFILVSSCLHLPLDRLWRKDYPALHPGFDWGVVWDSVKQASHNSNHQKIHFNFIHRSYLTPRKCFLVKRIDSSLCCLCTLQFPGTFFFLHIMCDCPLVAQFWCHVALILSDLVGDSVPVTVPVLILNDFSEF